MTKEENEKYFHMFLVRLLHNEIGSFVFENAKDIAPWCRDEDRFSFLSDFNLVTYFNEYIHRGISNDPKDKGGFTVAGITVPVYLRWRRQIKPAIGVAEASEEMKNMPFEHWRDIYRELIWDANNLVYIKDGRLAVVVADFIVNSGNAVKVIQQAFGIKADGIIGPKTICALNYYDPDIAIYKVNQARIDYLFGLCEKSRSYYRFIKGWCKRVVYMSQW